MSNTNILGVHVSNPSHILYIMCGVPGAGKSTKAKELADGSEIYSTDDRIEEAGDYNEFFAKMKKSGNFGPLGYMHKLNYKNACGAMDRGVNPIVIDNTNLSPKEARNYVEYALSLGYADDNIRFIDVGTGGATAEELADRNTHGVPLDKIRIMIKKYNANAPLTLEKVVNRVRVTKKL